MTKKCKKKSHRMVFRLERVDNLGEIKKGQMFLLMDPDGVPVSEYDYHPILKAQSNGKPCKPCKGKRQACHIIDAYEVKKYMKRLK